MGIFLVFFRFDNLGVGCWYNEGLKQSLKSGLLTKKEGAGQCQNQLANNIFYLSSNFQYSLIPREKS